ncbi:MAG: hypothetical protein F4Y03_10275 [Alphaproteobacteria bacterium]|nr:hypothetical protein [Alphaproteobacteria bacterium]
MTHHAPNGNDEAVLAARRSLYARVAQACNLEDQADMITTEIIETGGILNLPPDADPRSCEGDRRHMVELAVHGISVVAPSLLQAVETWIDTAGHAITRDARAA